MQITYSAQEKNNFVAPKWEEIDTQDFLSYSQYFVPERETQIDVICQIIPLEPKPLHILDLCCGEGLLTQALLEKFKECQVHGLDGSPDMLAHASAALNSYGERFEPKLFDLASKDWRQFPWKIDAVVSSLAIHHLNAQQKQSLFQDVFYLLKPEGVFIIADLIKPTTSMGITIAANVWDAEVQKRSLELGKNLEAYKQFQELHWNLYTYPEYNLLGQPSTLLEQIKWLEQVGFNNVDVLWMKGGHAIFGGFKPSQS
ncbi:hypothetical protein B4U84_28725 [Westiellopsis prolifica IICB1]|nr:hypothetical protein B4U84_28725 [Westiellopsis prolifica IICB1]